MIKTKRILKTAAFLTFLAPVALDIPGWIAYEVARAKKFEEKAVILVSTNDKKWPLNFYFPIVSGQMLYQTLMSRKPVLICGAKKEDLENVLYDSKVEAITLIGHGARNFWIDSEGVMVKLTYFGENTKFKKREINQYTCGDGRDPSLAVGLNGNYSSYIPPRKEMFFLEFIPDIVKKIVKLI